MKKFEMPEIRMDLFSVENVVTTSIFIEENETPFQPANNTAY